MAFEECVHADEECLAESFGGGDLLAGEGEALLDIPDGRVFQLCPPVPQQPGVARHHRDRALDAERFVRARQIRVGVLDFAAEARERRAARLEHGGGARVDRQAAEVSAPGHFRPAKLPVQFASEDGPCLAIRQRRA